MDNLGNTGLYRHEPWLHCAAPYVLRGEPGIKRRLALSRAGAIPGYVGKVRTQFMFYEMSP